MYGSHVWPRNRGYFRPRTLFKKCFDKSTLQVGISFEFGITPAVHHRIGKPICSFCISRLRIRQWVELHCQYQPRLPTANMVVLEGPEGPEARKCEVRKNLSTPNILHCVCVWRQKPCVDTKYETVGQGSITESAWDDIYTHKNNNNNHKEDTSPTEIVFFLNRNDPCDHWSLVLGLPAAKR